MSVTSYAILLSCTRCLFDRTYFFVLILIYFFYFRITLLDQDETCRSRGGLNKHEIAA
jgi:uncharacterized membrane protein